MDGGPKHCTLSRANIILLWVGHRTAEHCCACTLGRTHVERIGGMPAPPHLPPQKPDACTSLHSPPARVQPLLCTPHFQRDPSPARPHLRLALVPRTLYTSGQKVMGRGSRRGRSVMRFGPFHFNPPPPPLRRVDPTRSSETGTVRGLRWHNLPREGKGEWGGGGGGAQKHSQAGYGRPVDRGVWTAKTVK